LKENPTELYYIRHVLSTVLTGPLIARQSAHDLSLLLEHLRRAKRLLVNDRGRELSYMRSDFMIIDANDDLEHRLNMRIGVLRPQQIGFNLAPRKELSSSVIMNGGRFKPPKKTMLVCSSDEEEEANE
jgi:hypothetical protein